MTGRRRTDHPSPGFILALLFIGLSVPAAILTLYPPEKIVTAKPVDACIDGLVQTWDGKEWHPVELKKKGRPVPCEVRK